MSGLLVQAFDVYGEKIHSSGIVRLQPTNGRMPLSSGRRPIMDFLIGDIDPGIYQVTLDVDGYLPIAEFVSVPHDLPGRFEPVCVLDPRRVRSVSFPAYDIGAEIAELLHVSKNVLGYEGTSGELLYNALQRDWLRLAGLLNIACKAGATRLSNGDSVWFHVHELRELRQDRCFVRVPHELREHVRNSVAAGTFHEVSGCLHRPPTGYEHAGSFKTPDRYGNLQVTFFAPPFGMLQPDPGGSWLADLDIDDAGGLGHVFQVARNHLTGRATHPYDIHQILLRHQKLHTGYRLIL